MIDKFKKLRAMQRDEVVHRLRERVYREADRIRHYTGFGDNDPEFERLVAGHGSLKQYLRQGPARRFYASTQNRDEVSTLFEHHFPAWCDRALTEADRLCSHRIDLLGFTDVPLGPEINW